MFIKEPGLAFPDGARSMEVLPVDPQNPSPREKPDYLVPLGQAQWPEKVTSEIADIFRNVGLENPLKQKLVEPSARAFIIDYSSNLDGLENVNWEFAVDYFKHEAISLFDSKNEDKRKKQLDHMYEKHGTLVRHYDVYSDPSMPLG